MPSRQNKDNLFLGFFFLCSIAVFLSLSSVKALAQEGATPKRGFHPTGSYALTDLETFNTTNGNMQFRVPLSSLPAGRGGHPGARVGLYYNSKQWDTLNTTAPRSRTISINGA